MTALPHPHKIVTMADWLHRLGDVPPDRVRFYPIPGTATVNDVVEIEHREDVLCELVDGVLVEKPVELGNRSWRARSSTGSGISSDRGGWASLPAKRA